MNVLDRKLFNRGARDELRRRGGINDTANYANGGGVLSNIFNYFRTPDEQNPMLQMAEDVASSITPPPEYRVPIAPMYNMTQFGNLKPTDEISGREQFEIDYRKENPNPEVELQMKVLGKAKGGEQVKNAALAIGEDLLDVLNLGAGTAVFGANELTALGLDTLGVLTGGGDVSKSILRIAENLRQKGLVNRNDLFDAEGNLTLNTRLVGEGPYAGQLEKAKERLQETLKRQGIFSDEERDAIRRESLANIASADMEGGDLTRGVFADTGESIPAFSTRDPLGDAPLSLRRSSIGPDDIIAQQRRAVSTFPVGMQGNRPDVSPEYGSAPDSVRQGVLSALPGVVNEPPAETPKTTKQEISEALVNLGAGGIERIGGLFEGGVDRLQKLISGDDTPPAPTDERYAPELTTEAGPEAERTVSEELLETATSIVPQLTNKASEIVSSLTGPTEKEDAPAIDTDQDPTDQVIEEDETVLEVKTPSNPNEAAFSENVINEAVKTDRRFDPVATGIVQKITKGNLSDMSNDLGGVTDDESFDSYIGKYVKQFQGLFGEDEDQAAKDKGFAMAIFGSVFASTGDFGQASAAMIDVLRGDKATRQAREDEVKMLAINAAMDRAAADLRYKRDLEIAKTRGSLYGKRTEPVTQMYRLASDLYAGGGGEYDSYEDALATAKKIVERDYGVTLGTTDDIEKPDPKIQEIIQNLRDNNVSDDDIKKQLEDAAKANNKTIDLTIYGF